MTTIKSTSRLLNDNNGGAGASLYRVVTKVTDGKVQGIYNRITSEERLPRQVQIH